jgi:hypothetical protein
MALNTRTGFRADHAEFGRFMLSDQARKPAVEAAKDVARIAREMEDAAGAATYAANFRVNENTPPVVVAGNPRVGAEVYNDKRYAARREFGAKPGHRGATRSLRRAGAAVGELRGEIG